jgi:hypothetical protein
MLRSALSRHLLAALLGMLATLLSPRLLSAGNPLEEKLDKVISLDKPIDKNTCFQDVVEFLSDRFDLRITIDKEAFKKQLQVDNVAELPVHLPRVCASLGLVLQILARQVHGTYAVRRDRIEIVPLAKGKRPVRRDSKQLAELATKIRESLRKPSTLEKGVDTSLKDFVEFLNDRHDLPIIVDVGAFQRKAKAQAIEDMPIKLPAQKDVSVEKVLEKALKQVNATYEITGGAVLIIPAEKQDSI